MIVNALNKPIKSLGEKLLRKNEPQRNFEFFSIFCLRFSVEKEWVFCCFQLGKNGFRGLRVSLRVFFGAVKLMKF